MKQALLHILRAAGGRSIARSVNRLTRRLASFTHRVQFLIEWGIAPNPEWFDHYLDQYYLWPEYRTPWSWERGVFGLLAMRQGARVLELCCGDGFNAERFYAIRAGSIVSVDFDPDAIRAARRNFNAPNVTYEVADIRTAMPRGSFDNVIWDAAIEHFTEDEIRQLMSNIKARLAGGGILSGHTIVELEHGKSHHEHEYEFQSKEDLLRFLQPYFRNVRIFETIYPTRHNLYFFASDDALPFDEAWRAQVVYHLSST
jgi:SAM-dependent methyltransferase